MSKHTLGPWVYDRGRYVPDVYADIGEGRRKSVIGEDMSEADGRLIAAAPELLAALRNTAKMVEHALSVIVDDLDTLKAFSAVMREELGRCDLLDMIEEAKDAIAKAEG